MNPKLRLFCQLNKEQISLATTRFASFNNKVEANNRFNSQRNRVKIHPIDHREVLFELREIEMLANKYQTAFVQIAAIWDFDDLRCFHFFFLKTNSAIIFERQQQTNKKIQKIVKFSSYQSTILCAFIIKERGHENERRKVLNTFVVFCVPGKNA